VKAQGIGGLIREIQTLEQENARLKSLVESAKEIFRQDDALASKTLMRRQRRRTTYKTPTVGPVGKANVSLKTLVKGLEEKEKQ
jgi:hypothetical protein